MSEDSPKPSWMNIPEADSAPAAGAPLPPPSGTPAGGAGQSGGSGRSGQRRKRNLLAAIGGGVVVVGATVAIVLAAAGSRSGTLVDGASGASGASGATGVTPTTSPSTSAIAGAAAAELLAKLPVRSISAGSVQLGPNVAITSMTVSKNSDGSFSGSGTVSLAGTVSVNVNATITDADNWSLTVASTASTKVQVGGSGIQLDPSTITGSITDAAGAITWNLSGSTITWPIATGASLTTQFSIGNTCPFSDPTKCRVGNYLYLGLPSGSLAISGMPTVSLAGGITLDGEWARLEGTATASASIAVNGASVSMSNPSLTVWRGLRADSPTPNMTMPDTSAFSNWTNIEFCGTFAISASPLVNQSTIGCMRWTPSGIVLGQVGQGSSMTLSGGSAPAGTTADVKGFGWSTMSAADIAQLTVKMPDGRSVAGAISFSGVATKLFPSTLSIGGKANLPGIVTSAIGLGSDGYTVDVTGQITSNSIALQGTVPVTINFGNEPFKVSVQSLTLGLSAGGGNGFAMTLGTKSDVTLGYGSTARTVNSSITFAAATSPATGFTLSLNAVGNPGGGDTTDGLTPATRLATPSQATFLVPDMFGINGLNLWSLTGQIGWQGASPSLAFSTTTYLNPLGSSTKSVMQCTGTCDDSDWMIGNLLLDVSYTNPCFAYSFDSNSGGGSIGIDGGVLKASKFQIGVSPNGCSIVAGGTTITLPKAFAGFAFSASFGTATVNVATQVSVDGFTFSAALGNVNLGNFKLTQMSLYVGITSSSSSVTFDALTAINNFGTMAFHADMSADSSGMSWNVTGDICTDTSKQYCDPSAIAGGLGSQSSGPSSTEPTYTNGVTPDSTSQKVGFKILKLHFQQSGTIDSCPTLDASVDGVIYMSKTTYTLLGPEDNAVLPDGSVFKGSGFKIDCNGIQYAGFGISFKHTSSYLRSSGEATKTLLLSWSNNTLQGSLTVNMYRHLDVDKKKCCGGYYRYNEDVYFGIKMNVVISSTFASFGLSCHIDTGRLDGWLTFYLDTTGDFTGKVRISVDVPWSDSTYHVSWDGL